MLRRESLADESAAALDEPQDGPKIRVARRPPGRAAPRVRAPSTASRVAGSAAARCRQATAPSSAGASVSLSARALGIGHLRRGGRTTPDPSRAPSAPPARARRSAAAPLRCASRRRRTAGPRGRTAGAAGAAGQRHCRGRRVGGAPPTRADPTGDRDARVAARRRAGPRTPHRCAGDDRAADRGSRADACAGGQQPPARPPRRRLVAVGRAHRAIAILPSHENAKLVRIVDDHACSTSVCRPTFGGLATSWTV